MRCSPEGVDTLALNYTLRKLVESTVLFHQNPAFIKYPKKRNTALSLPCLRDKIPYAGADKVHQILSRVSRFKISSAFKYAKL